ncbi:TPA: thioredoxin fold domain-containing protein [Klebsiella michiganensis]|nr:thioredoxin fold domain-containing protein [Klebsiella michiganensis]
MSGHAIELTEDNFDDFISNTHYPVLVDLWAPWCVPCRTMAPVIDKLARNTIGRLHVAKIDVEKYPSIMEKFQVRGIPTLLLFKGEAEPARLVGAQTLGQLNTWLADKKLQLNSSISVQQLEELEWGSFYGDEELHQFFYQRTINHARSGTIISSSAAYWFQGKGTLSAVIAHHYDNNIFTRLTGIPIAISKLLDRCEYTKEEQITSLFNTLCAGKDFRLIPLKFLQWWLSEEFTSWSTHLRDPRLLSLMKQWQDIFSCVLAGSLHDKHASASLIESVTTVLEDYQHPDRQLEKIIAVILINIAELPVTTNAEKWEIITRNMNWAKFQLLQIQSGWSDEDRATPALRMQWFLDKESKSQTGKLSQEDIDELRSEWTKNNSHFLQKESAFQTQLEKLTNSVGAEWQRKVERLFSEAPDF